MRVLSGSARGRKLETVKGLDVRPTTDRVKESIFNIIQFSVEGANTLDLFAGSGALGIEALSRGAKSVTFVEPASEAFKMVQKNVKTCGLEKNANIVKSEAEMFLKRYDKEPFDLVLLDPPYGKGLVEQAINWLQACEALSDRGIIVAESETGDIAPDMIGAVSLQRSYRYGKTMIHIYRRGGQA